MIAEARDPKEAAKARESIRAMAELQDVMSALEANIKQHGRVLPGTAAAQERDALTSQAKIKYKNAAELGAITGPDVPLMEGALGSVGGMYLADPLPRLQQAMSTMRSGLAKGLSAGGVPGDRIDEAWFGRPNGAKGAVSADQRKALIEELRQARAGRR